MASIDGEIDETLNVSQQMGVVRAQTDTLGETFTLTDAVTPFVGVQLAERIALNHAQVVNQKATLVLAEQLMMAMQGILALPADVSENLLVTSDQSAQLALQIIEALGIGETVAPALLYHLSISENLLVADTLARFLGVDVMESLAITPAMSGDAYKAARVDEALTIADGVTPVLLFRLTCAETLDFTAAEAVQMIFNAEVDETVEIAGAYLAPNGSVTTWVMNTHTGGVTEYQNYAFNSFARVGNKYLGAAEDGLYELLGDTDDGTDIVATIRSGFAQWSGTHLGSFKAAYLAVAGAGDYVLRVLTRDGKTHNYRVTAADGRTVKVNMGKGLRSRYFAFELVSTGQDFDLDTLEFIPLVADRRV